MNYLISIELHQNAFAFHIVVQKPLGNSYTLTSRSVIGKAEQERLIQMMLENDYEQLVTLFKEKYDIHHAPITFSYGPNLRKWLKENRQNKQEAKNIHGN